MLVHSVRPQSGLNILPSAATIRIKNIVTLREKKDFLMEVLNYRGKSVSRPRKFTKIVLLCAITMKWDNMEYNLVGGFHRTLD